MSQETGIAYWRLAGIWGGTHFIVIDADKAFTANCLDDSFFKKTDIIS